MSASDFAASGLKGLLMRGYLNDRSPYLNYIANLTSENQTSRRSARGGQDQHFLRFDSQSYKAG